MDDWLTYKEGAAEVGRSVRALQRWHRKKGMPMRLDADGRKRVRRDVLYAYYRKALTAWPPHRYKMRRIMRDTPSEETY